VSLQSTLSAASVVATFYLTKQDLVSPLNVRVWSSCQMNRYVQPPVNDQDCVCGAAALIYEIPLSLDVMLWDLVKSCHKGMQEMITAGCAFEWLAAVNGIAMHKAGVKVQLPVVTTVSSSTSVNPIRVNYGEGLKVNGVKMIGAGAAYEEIVHSTHTNPIAIPMPHALIFNEELTVSVEYNSAEISDGEAEKYCAIYQEVLKGLTTPEKELQLSVRDVLKRTQGK